MSLLGCGNGACDRTRLSYILGRVTKEGFLEEVKLVWGLEETRLL